MIYIVTLLFSVAIVSWSVCITKRMNDPIMLQFRVIMYMQRRGEFSGLTMEQYFNYINSKCKIVDQFGRVRMPKAYILTNDTVEFGNKSTEQEEVIV